MCVALITFLSVPSYAMQSGNVNTSPKANVWDIKTILTSIGILVGVGHAAYSSYSHLTKPAVALNDKKDQKDAPAAEQTSGLSSIVGKIQATVDEWHADHALAKKVPSLIEAQNNMARDLALVKEDLAGFKEAVRSGVALPPGMQITLGIVKQAIAVSAPLQTAKAVSVPLQADIAASPAATALPLPQIRRRLTAPRNPSWDLQDLIAQAKEDSSV